ncbi:MAG: MFS transporter, partial [Candidatus Eremiobacteraeota bacterium]|nr:MFS transporter [Candidatus Eremiobacteraeota bacterium]
ASIPFVHSLPSLLATIVLFSIGLSLSNATIAALLSDAAPKGAQGTVLSVGDSMQSISGIIMPAIATSVLAYYGSLWTAAISFFFVSIALALGVAAQARRATEPAS